jgi:uncharacterized pyridoxal phosphate-containing UPF0001 family protein
MTMAPHSRFGEKATHQTFSLVREALCSLSCRYPQLKELSMGMSSDFEIALEQGSTLLRIGSLIFSEKTL